VVSDAMGNNPEDDFLTLCSAKNLLFARCSTFGWWAAFLGYATSIVCLGNNSHSELKVDDEDRWQNIDLTKQ